MPISLTKTLAEAGEFEDAITIRIVGAEENENAFNDIDDLVDYLDKIITLPLGRKLKMPDLGKGTDLIFSSHDGLSPLGVSVYVQYEKLPPEHQSKILGGIGYTLNNLGIKTKEWVKADQGGIIIPIESWGSPKHGKTPKIFLTAPTFEKIMAILGNPLHHLTVASKYFHTVLDAAALHDKIVNYKQEVHTGLAPVPTKNIERFLNSLEKLAWQAMHYGYEKVEAFNSTIGKSLV